MRRRRHKGDGRANRNATSDSLKRQRDLALAEVNNKEAKTVALARIAATKARREIWREFETKRDALRPEAVA